MESIDRYKEISSSNLIASVIDIDKYNSLDDCFLQGLNNIKLDLRLFDDAVIIIKPNLTTGKSSENSGITTPVDIVETVIRYLNIKANNLKICIVESDSDGRIEETYKSLGYWSLVEKFENVRLIDLGKETYYKIILPQWSKARMIAVPEIMMQGDFFINIANLKRHNMERLTCIWKNLYGLPANHLVRMRYHPVMSEVLFALNYLFWPDLAVVDARICLGGSGPMAGVPYRYGKLLLSTNALAADLTALKLINENYKKIPSIKYAIKKLKLNPSKVKITGDAFIAKELPFTSETVYRMLRLSMFSRRIALSMENMFFTGWLISQGLRAGGVKQFSGGGMQTLGTSARILFDFLKKFDLSEQVHG